MRKKLIILLLFLPFGCRTTISPAFVRAVYEHQLDCQEVNGSLVSTFYDEMEKETQPEVIDAYQEIINNLKTITKQAETLDKYLWNNLTDKELKEFLKNKWRVNE